MGNSNWPKFRRFWFPVILYSVIIFCVSSVPNVKTPLSQVQFDKFLHILVYMPFGFLFARAICNTTRVIPGGMLLGVVFLASSLYGFSDEVHQLFVSGRDASMVDVFSDTLGGVVGGYVYPLFLKHTKDR
jgi:VanZ family protein